MRLAVGTALKLVVCGVVSFVTAHASAAQDPEPDLTLLPWDDAAFTSAMLSPLPWDSASPSDAMLSPLPWDASFAPELTPIPWNAAEVAELSPVPWDP